MRLHRTAAPIVLLVLLLAFVVVAAAAANQTNVSCPPGKATVPAGHTPPCNYQRKSGLAALLLQIFVGGLGAPWFYLGYNLYGSMFLWLPVVLCCCAFAITCRSLDVEQAAEDTTVWVVVTRTGVKWCVIIAEIVVWAVLVGLFATNKVKDANGLSLVPY